MKVKWKLFEVVSKMDNTLTPSINYYGDKVRLKFTRSVLQQKTVTYRHKKVAKIYVVSGITNFHNINSYLTLENVLFGAAKLQKVDTDKHRYFRYGIGFDRHGIFRSKWRNWQKCIIF